MPTRSRNRPGFALAVSLAAIVIIGAIITGIFFASTQEYRMSRNSAMQARALTSAEYGMNSILRTGQWNPDWNTGAVGHLADTVYTPNDGGLDTVRVTKLSDGMFMLTSTGRVGPPTGAQARHRLGALVTLAIPQLSMLGALTTRGKFKIGGNSELSGVDTPVDDWDCPPPGAALPGLAMPDVTQIVTSGCGGSSLTCVTGSPKVTQTPLAAKDSTYFNYGPSLDWDKLTAMAPLSHTYAPGANLNGLGATVSGGACKTADGNNWGEPLRDTPALSPCWSYFPIIYAKGDLKITGGEGQGILLVAGDLIVSGNAKFYGPVIVRGTLTSQGTGGHFNGGVMAANVDLDLNTLIGDAVVSYSSCALSRALAGAATPTFLPNRSWTELF